MSICFIVYVHEFPYDPESEHPMKAFPWPVTVDWYNAQPALAAARELHRPTEPYRANPEFVEAAQLKYGIDLTDPRQINQCLLRWYTYGPVVADYAASTVNQFLELTPEQVLRLQQAITDAWTGLVLRLEPYIHPLAREGHAPTTHHYRLSPARTRHFAWTSLALTDDEREHIEQFEWMCCEEPIARFPLLWLKDAPDRVFPVEDLDPHSPIKAYLSVAAMQAMLDAAWFYLEHSPGTVPDTALSEFRAIVLDAFLHDLPSGYQFWTDIRNHPVWPIVTEPHPQPARI